MSFVDILLGKPLATSDERAEQIGPVAGIPIFGLDALSSAAYGPEAALTLLIPLGAAGVAYIVPVSASIIVLLAIVYFSYRQTIAAYPGGGGSYTVASENLGTYPGLLAAAALMLDYVLTAAVGISAGVGALVSAVPQLQPHTLAICLGILVVVTIVNLRGVREAGVFFMIPTYAFLGSMLVRHPDRRHENGLRGGASGSRCRAACECCGARDCRGEHVAAAASVLQRLHGHDGRRGGQQRRARLPRADRAQRAADADRDHRPAGNSSRGHRVPGSRVRHSGDRSRASPVTRA